MRTIILTAILALSFLAAPIASSLIGTSPAKAWAKCEGGYARDEAKVSRTCL